MTQRGRGLLHEDEGASEPIASGAFPSKALGLCFQECGFQIDGPHEARSEPHLPGLRLRVMVARRFDGIVLCVWQERNHDDIDTHHRL